MKTVPVFAFIQRSYHAHKVPGLPTQGDCLHHEPRRSSGFVRSSLSMFGYARSDSQVPHTEREGHSDRWVGGCPGAPDALGLCLVKLCSIHDIHRYFFAGSSRPHRNSVRSMGAKDSVLDRESWGVGESVENPRSILLGVLGRSDQRQPTFSHKTFQTEICQYI